MIDPDDNDPATRTISKKKDINSEEQNTDETKKLTTEETQ